jgi:seryl-tRNA synthetase
VLDLKLIRADPDAVRAALARRGPEAAAGLDRALELDLRRRELLPELEGLRGEQNEANGRISSAPDAQAREREIAAMREVAGRVKALERELAGVQEQLRQTLAPLPNLPEESAAPGPADELVRTVGEPPAFAFEPRDHLELAGPAIDMERAARLSGARFAYLLGDLVFLELALVRWTLEILRSHGFQPVIPPVLVREQALYGTGFLPDTEQQLYSLPDDELHLVGTSEVALASLHADEVLDAERLPLRYAGFSPCFRREAGAAGKDTRGIFRVHQFDKVEMFSFVAPADSVAEHERILAIEEQILTALGLPYRVVNIAVSDLGNSAAKKYDCEAWLPSYGAYRELTSCSNTTDYQARRLNIRVRAERSRQGDGAPSRGLETPHTLNGTAVAVGRTLVALLENGQQADGSVALPEVLVPYGAPARLEPAV